MSAGRWSWWIPPSLCLPTVFLMCSRHSCVSGDTPGEGVKGRSRSHDREMYWLMQMEIPTVRRLGYSEVWLPPCLNSLSTRLLGGARSSGCLPSEFLRERVAPCSSSTDTNSGLDRWEAMCSGDSPHALLFTQAPEREHTQYPHSTQQANWTTQHPLRARVLSKLKDSNFWISYTPFNIKRLLYVNTNIFLTDKYEQCRRRVWIKYNTFLF